MALTIPAELRETCRGSADREAWLASLPQIVDDLKARWTLDIGPPFQDAGASSAWVAPAFARAEGRAVLKIGLPHMEARDEIAGLRFWNGDPTVRLLRSDMKLHAMLLERCEPGTPLKEVPEGKQDVVIARLLRRLWRSPSGPHSFRPLTEMLNLWMSEAQRRPGSAQGGALFETGLDLLSRLPASAPASALLATDLHAGNVLRAQRMPWLVIDPKPFVGDPAYDATQHLLNCRGRLSRNPKSTIDRFSELLGVEPERVQLWTFARLVTDPGASWQSPEFVELLHRLAPK